MRINTLSKEELSHNTMSFGDYDKSLDEERVKKSGLLDIRRNVNIFYDGMGDVAHVIIVNFSTSGGRNGTFCEADIFNRDHTTITYLGVYVFKCMLGEGYSLLERFRNSILESISSRRINCETDHENKISTQGEFALIHSMKRSNFKLPPTVKEKILIDPRFYTNEYESMVNGEYSGLDFYENNSRGIYNGYEFLDSFTKIVYYKKRDFKNFYNNLMNDNYPPDGVIDSDSIIHRMNLSTGMNSMVVGGVFDYDTNRDDIIIRSESSIMGKKHMTDEESFRQFDTFVKDLKSSCDDMSSDLGNIRVLYYPTLLGSKCRVILKDHNNKSVDFNPINGGVEDKVCVDAGTEIDVLVDESVMSRRMCTDDDGDVPEYLLHTKEPDDMIRMRNISNNM